MVEKRVERTSKELSSPLNTTDNEFAALPLDEKVEYIFQNMKTLYET